MATHLSEERRWQVEELLASGAGLCETVRRSGAAKATVARIAAALGISFDRSAGMRRHHARRKGETMNIPASLVRVESPPRTVLQKLLHAWLDRLPEEASFEAPFSLHWDKTRDEEGNTLYERSDFEAHSAAEAAEFLAGLSVAERRGLARLGWEEPAAEKTGSPAASPAEQGSKTCAACGELKPLDAFPAAWGYKHGRHSMCLPCRREYNRRAYEEQKAKKAGRVKANGTPDLRDPRNKAAAPAAAPVAQSDTGGGRIVSSPRVAPPPPTSRGMSEAAKQTARAVLVSAARPPAERRVDWLGLRDWLAEQVAAGQSDRQLAAELGCKPSAVEKARCVLGILREQPNGYSTGWRLVTKISLNAASLALANAYGKQQDIPAARAAALLIEAGAAVLGQEEV